MMPNVCRSLAELWPNSLTLPSRTFSRILRTNFGPSLREMHHGENWGGGNFVMIMMLLRVYNNLLLYEYIYYFTPVHF